ncbi:MAG: aspartate aminotransferase family protein [Desulfobulbaceae bacterium]|jgi:acetylornithine/N-succinyldiaminopimelate aminotransferase|nr:aspartate aminotransferase family protein [Desulfobulbaceae bacterium]
MKDLMEMSDQLFVNTYGRFPAVMVEGDGCRLTDAKGSEYLDFASGIAVCSLGHCHPVVTSAIIEQTKKLVHVSNLYYTLPQIELANMLVDNSFGDKVFLANSGAEANEAAIKLARKHAETGCFEIISLEGSFHGRTLATLAATGQRKYHQGFEPLPVGFYHAPFGDLAALSKLITHKTCAILIEPLQGEGGVRPLGKEYLQGIRKLCDQNSILLIVDEIQVGMGRTGSLFAYEQFGIRPDILTTAKALGNGLPIGAMITTNKVAAAFSPGDHATTFGGNPVSCAAACAVLKTILTEGFLDTVKERGDYLYKGLKSVADQYNQLFAGVRGHGLIQGLVLHNHVAEKGPEIVNQLFNYGVLVTLAGGKVIRCTPPLIVSTEEIDAMVAMIEEVVSNI